MAEIRLSTQDSSLYQSKNQNLPNSFEYAVLHNPNQDSVVSVKPEGGVTALYEFLVKPVLPSVLSSLNDLPQKAVHLFGEIQKNPQYQKAVAEAQARKLNDEKESEKIDKLYQASVSLGLIPQPENVFIGVSLLLGLGCGSEPVLKAIDYVEQIEADADQNDYEAVLKTFDSMLATGTLNDESFETTLFESIANRMLSMMKMFDKEGRAQDAHEPSGSDAKQMIDKLHKSFEILCKTAERNNKIDLSIYQLWIKELKLYNKVQRSPVEPYKDLNNLYRRAEKRALLDAEMYLDWVHLIRRNEIIDTKQDARKVFSVAHSAFQYKRLRPSLLLELAELLWEMGEYEELAQFVDYAIFYLDSLANSSVGQDETFFYDELGNKNLSQKIFYISSEQLKKHEGISDEDRKEVLEILDYRRRLNSDSLKEKKLKDDLNKYKNGNALSYSVLVHPSVMAKAYLESKDYQKALQVYENAFISGGSDANMDLQWMRTKLDILKREARYQNSYIEGQAAQEFIEIYEKVASRAHSSESVKILLSDEELNYLLILSLQTLGRVEEAGIVLKEFTSEHKDWCANSILIGLKFHKLIENFIKQGSKEPIFYIALVAYYNKNSLYKSAIKVCEQAERNSVFDSTIYMQWIVILKQAYDSKAKRMTINELAKQVVEVYQKARQNKALIKAWEVSASTDAYRIVISSYRLLGYEQEAKNVIAEAIKNIDVFFEGMLTESDFDVDSLYLREALYAPECVGTTIFFLFD